MKSTLRWITQVIRRSLEKLRTEIYGREHHCVDRVSSTCPATPNGPNNNNKQQPDKSNQLDVTIWILPVHKHYSFIFFYKYRISHAFHSCPLIIHDLIIDPNRHILHHHLRLAYEFGKVNGPVISSSSRS